MTATPLTAEPQAARGLVVRGRPETREALLNAVEELVAERGWTGCSLQAVARRSGLTTGAVYSTFGSRGALLAAALVRRSAEQARLPLDGRSAAEAVAAFARSYHAAVQTTEGTNLVLAQLDLVSLARTDPVVAEALSHAHASLLAGLVEDLGQLMALSPVQARLVGQRLLALLQGFTLQQVAFGSDVREQDVVDAALLTVGL